MKFYSVAIGHILLPPGVTPALRKYAACGPAARSVAPALKRQLSSRMPRVCSSCSRYTNRNSAPSNGTWISRRVMIEGQGNASLLVDINKAWQDGREHKNHDENGHSHEPCWIRKRRRENAIELLLLFLQSNDSTLGKDLRQGEATASLRRGSCRRGLAKRPWDTWPWPLIAFALHVLTV